nr:transposase and inactivated derivatives [Bradyrhizobium sp. DOA9]
MQMRREGWRHCQNNTRRVYRKLDLQLRNKSPRRQAEAKLHDNCRPVTRANETWAMDFIHDQLATGGKHRVLTIIDYFRSLLAGAGAAVHLPQHRYPGRLRNEVEFSATIRIDQGSEFVSRDVDLCAYQRDVTLDFSRPTEIDQLIRKAMLLWIYESRRDLSTTSPVRSLETERPPQSADEPVILRRQNNSIIPLVFMECAI